MIERGERRKLVKKNEERKKADDKNGKEKYKKGKRRLKGKK